MGRVGNACRLSLCGSALSTVTVLLALGVAGCGGASTSTDTVTDAVISGSPAAAASPSSSATPSVDAAAEVAGTPIPKKSYQHWLTVYQALGVTRNVSHQALGFLISSDWLLGEAAAQHVTVSEREVKQRLASVKKESFPKVGSFQKFLSISHETEADLLARLREELLESKISAKVTAGKAASKTKALLASFQSAFKQRWKDRTTCKAEYVMEDCSEYGGAAEYMSGSGASSSSSVSSSSSAATGGSSNSTKSSKTSSAGKTSSSSGDASASSAATPATSAAPSPSGEVYTPPGEMSISSPAFGRNEDLPKEYTCDGANISPALEWQNVPANAKALVLFVIDDSTDASNPNSGIRWIVGDIDPHSTGVAAGKIPTGGIVGSDTQGHSGYGGICPEPGKSSTIEFQLYALSETIQLSPGFSPGVAESEYGAHKLIIGTGSASTYAVYARQ